MDARKVSAAVGFTLLMGCVVAVAVVMYNGSGARSSYRNSMEKSWKTREVTMKGRQDIVGSMSTTSESPVQEAKKLADDLQKLFMNNAGGATKRVGSGIVTVVEDDINYNEQPKIVQSTTPKPLDSSSVSSSPSPSKASFPMTSEKPETSYPFSQESFPPFITEVTSKPSNSHSSFQSDESNENDKPVDLVSKSQIISLKKDVVRDSDDYPTLVPSSINSKQQQNSRGEHFPGNQPTTTIKHRSNILLVKASAPASSTILPHHQAGGSRLHSSMSMPPQVHSRFDDRMSYDGGGGGAGVNERKEETFQNDEGGGGGWGSVEDFGSKEEDDYEEDDQQYVVNDVPNNPRDPLKAMGSMLQLVTDVYNRGKEGLDVPGFLRVINETVQRGNNNNLLNQLNQMYSRPGNWSTTKALFSPKSEAAVGRNALENSLSAFVFMSFGVFLLNQIHNFMGSGVGRTKTTTEEDGNIRQGRKLDFGGLGDVSELNFLFESPSEAFNPPPLLNNSENGEGGFVIIADTITTATTNTAEGIDHTMNETTTPPMTMAEKKNLLNRTRGDSSNHVNNMFRAAINLVNAYTKDTQALDCIWSKYCQDLDKTSAEHGSLYSIAARINSVGLRLIMGQIPTELTVDVILRSLLGWDGLPCSKMFSKCNIVQGRLLRQESERNQSLSSGIQ